MPRSVLLALALAAATTASAVLPIAPLQPRIGPLYGNQSDPAAASNGTSTLLAWTNWIGPSGQTDTIYARLLGVQAAAMEIGPGAEPLVAWNGSEYLIAHSHPLGVTVVHPDGTLGERRTIDTSVSAVATALAWDGAQWVIGMVSEGTGRLLLLDRELHVTRTSELGTARSIGLTTIEGRLWVVHQRDQDSEAFALDDQQTRFRVAGRVRMVGALAIFEHNLWKSVLDPRTGFSDPRPILATSDIPLGLVHLAPLGDGAVLVVQSIVGKSLLLVAVDATGSRTLYTPALTPYTTPGAAAIAGSTLFVPAWGNTESSQIYAFPLDPLPVRAFTLTRDAIVSIGDIARQNDAMIAANGNQALAFWNQTIDDAGRQAAFMRTIDAHGIPYGPVTQLPFAISDDSDLAVDGDRFVLVWASPFEEIFASTGGAPVLLGYGSGPAVARGAHGTFVVWRSRTGTVMGTPLRDDATPHVPNGFPILPSLTALQSAPAIIAVEQGFNVLWSAEGVVSVIISPAGTPQTSSVLAEPASGKPIMAGTVAAWPRMLAAFGGGGTFPFDRYVPNWGDDWTPVALHPMNGGRHLVTIRRAETLYTSVVTVVNGQIRDVTPLRRLGHYAIDENGITVVGGNTIVVYGTHRVEVATGYPVKRRAVR